MDTLEQLTGYYYAGKHNLSNGELFFFLLLREASKQLSVDSLLIGMITLEQPIKQS